MNRILRLTLAASLILSTSGCGAATASKTKKEEEHLNWLGTWALNYTDTMHKLPEQLKDIEMLEQTVVLEDAWGTSVEYKFTDDGFMMGHKQHKKGFTITSAGPDKEMGTDDDIQVTHKDIIDSLPNGGR